MTVQYPDPAVLTHEAPEELLRIAHHALAKIAIDQRLREVLEAFSQQRKLRW